jgi:7,8-dihydropterin-6-yl-methyl-4-(beta-D-ribofuranosyl)aminobenzene 5'-phosphate synthase
MSKYFRVASLLILLGLSTISALEPATDKHDHREKYVQVTIIYDNYQLDQNLKPDWGFACLVEYQGHKLLFDAGRDAEIFKENLTRLQIDPKEIPTLFISHEHGDHTAGVPWITEVNPAIKCYFPTPYAKQLKDRGTLPAQSQPVPDPLHLHGPFYSTGDSFDSFREQGLIVKKEDGGVLITGCGHPGAVAMVARAQNELGVKVHTVIGGLHLMQTPGEKIDQIADELKKLGVKQICPTHCTGDASIARFKEAFAEHYISGGAGKEIIIN